MTILGPILRNGVFIVFGLVAAYLLIFVQPPKPQVDEGYTLITYWEKWTANEEAQMKVIVEDFNRTVGVEKKIKVQYLSVSSVDRKTLVATASGIPPDVAGLWAAQVVQFSSQDAVEPLDDLAAEYNKTAAPENQIKRENYKPVYWDACSYNGKLYGLVSTPSAIALHYRRRIFIENEEKLRAAGLLADGRKVDDPPKTIEELDRYAQVLDKRDGTGKMVRAGYLPAEPGWYQAQTPLWFGGSVYDPTARKLTLTDPKVIEAFNWIRGYTNRLGKSVLSEINSAKGGFDSPTNPFMSADDGKSVVVVMEQQGPWMANFINNRKSAMYEWNTGVKLRPDETEDEKAARFIEYTKTRTLAYRREHCEWAAAPFPSNVPGVSNAAFADFDVFFIPKCATRSEERKRAAFEFIAYVNRRDVQRKLCSMHCKNTALANPVDADPKVNPAQHAAYLEYRKYLESHPNPYIEVFEDLASSPNARAVPPCPIWPEVADELNNVVQKVALMEKTDPPEAVEKALAEAQRRLQPKLETYLRLMDARKGGTQQ